jgi:phospholipase C
MMSRTARVVAALLIGASLLTAPAAAADPTAPTVASGGTTTPIKHFVFLMQGDRSFDNYFGTYPGADGIPAGTCQKVVITRPACVQPYSLHGKVPQTLGAGSVELNNQYNKGAMNGFVAAYQLEGRDGTAAMGYYDERDLPTYWDLASRYVLFDRFFSSTREGERVNRSYWVTGTGLPPGNAQQLNAGYSKQLTIFDRLQSTGVSWKFYVQGYDPNQTFRTTSKTHPTTQPVRVPLLNYARFVDDPALKSHIVDMSQYYKDLDAGTLPAVAYIASSGPSERSARSITSGQKLVTDLVGNLMLSKYWNSSAFLLSYDGSGGWYDHVSPPQVDKNGYGMRVPALLVSPYARRGYVDNTTFDYTSALAFIEKNWQLAPLAARDRSATSIANAFDFTAAPRPAQVNFGQPVTPKNPPVSVGVVYWCYGIALLLVLGFVAFATTAPARSRRRHKNREPSVRQIETVGAKR